MIFAAEGHIEMIRNGLQNRHIQILQLIPEVVKTQTRRVNRGVYKVGKDYAVQKRRGAKAEPDIRIVMDRIWEERCISLGIYLPVRFYNYISDESAWAEGGYTPEEFEKLFREINPNWNGIIRYGFEFHVIEVQK